MRRLFRQICFILNLLGFDIIKFVATFYIFGFYRRDYNRLKKQMEVNSDFKFGKFYPILNERFTESGATKGHYFQTDLLIAQKIFKNSPIRHIDIGSRIDGFVAHIASFREIEVLDIRPLRTKIRNVIFTQTDLMELPDYLKECCDSLSSLHAIEHFGLGRYGDTIDINGHLRALDNIYSIIKPGGTFYFSVPIGKQRIEFNAHRVFNISYLIKNFNGKFKIQNFNYVDEYGVLYTDVPLEEENIASNFNCMYGCGIFELIKI